MGVGEGVGVGFVEQGGACEAVLGPPLPSPRAILGTPRVQQVVGRLEVAGAARVEVQLYAGLGEDAHLVRARVQVRGGLGVG